MRETTAYGKPIIIDGNVYYLQAPQEEPPTRTQTGSRSFSAILYELLMEFSAACEQCFPVDIWGGFWRLDFPQCDDGEIPDRRNAERARRS